MVVVWSVFMLLMFCFLNSNLRANIILVQYEPDINTVEDAFDRYVHAFSDSKLNKEFTSMT